MPAEKITVWECGACSTLYDSEDGALECCPNLEELSGWQCSECGELYGPDDKSSARECCE